MAQDAPAYISPRTEIQSIDLSDIPILLLDQTARIDFRGE